MNLNLFGSFPQAVQLGVQMSSMFLSMKHQHSIQCDDLDYRASPLSSH